MARQHRTIFISDVHLGTRGCKAELLADFLACNTCETLYLVGDIFDGWALQRRWFWCPQQTRVVHEILKKVDQGTRIVYIPGNHDEFLRRYCGRMMADIEIVSEAIHETADGKRLWVLHGDVFDSVISYAKWLAHIGDRAYSVALALNAKSPTAQMITPFETVNAPPVELELFVLSPAPAGNGSVSVTASALPGPLFVMVTVLVRFQPR